MKKKFFLRTIFLFSTIILFSSCTCGRIRKPPILGIYKEFRPVKKKVYIVPYSMNLFSLYTLYHQKNTQKVKEYINWYFNHLNYPDKYGITGSIYDYIISTDGKEKTTETFDSIDSYSGTFLLLLEKYYEKTKDEFLIRKNREKIEDIAYTIVYLQDKDGLTTPSPDIKVKYLMDNCEAFLGLKSFLNLSEKLNWKIPPLFEEAVKLLQNGILNKFYDEKNKNFYWAISKEIKYKSNWDIFYPDAYAQLFPIFSKVLENEKIKKHLWTEFMKRYKTKINSFSPEQKIIIELTEREI